MDDWWKKKRLFNVADKRQDEKKCSGGRGVNDTPEMEETAGEGWREKGLKLTAAKSPALVNVSFDGEINKSNLTQQLSFWIRLDFSELAPDWLPAAFSGI